MKKRITFPGVIAGVIFVARKSPRWRLLAPSKTVRQSVPPFPGTLVNARYVYVTSYDWRPSFNVNLLRRSRGNRHGAGCDAEVGKVPPWSTSRARLIS